MTTDPPRIPGMPGRNTSRIHRPKHEHCLQQALQSEVPVGCSASRNKAELHPTKDRYVSQADLYMDDDGASMSGGTQRNARVGKTSSRPLPIADRRIARRVHPPPGSE